jgi:hypothetical protein
VSSARRSSLLFLLLHIGTLLALVIVDVHRERREHRLLNSGTLIPPVQSETVLLGLSDVI